MKSEIELVNDALLAHISLMTGAQNVSSALIEFHIQSLERHENLSASIYVSTRDKFLIVVNPSLGSRYLHLVAQVLLLRVCFKENLSKSIKLSTPKLEI